MKVLQFFLFFISVALFSNAATAAVKSVKVLNQNIIPLKSGVGSISLDQRIKLVEEKVTKLIDDRLFDKEQLTVASDEDSINIVYKDTSVLTITKKDARDFKTDQETLANQYKTQIQVSIVAIKKLKGPKKLMISIAYALVATLLLLFLLTTISRLFPFITNAFSGPKKKLLPAIKIKNYEVISSDRVADFFILLARVLKVIVTLVIVYFYIPIILSFFPQTSEFAPKLYGYIGNPIKKISKVIVDFIPNLFFIGVILIFTYYILAFIKFLFREIERGTISFSGFHKEWAMPTYKLVRFIVVAFSAVMIFPYLPGSDTPAFQGISMFLGILLSLGSSTAISNMVGGTVLTYMRPFKIGDRVKIADTVGDVISRDLLVTRIKTTKNVNITIPNSIILANHIVNYSTSAAEEGVILHTTITIGYDVPWDNVHALLIDSANAIDMVLDNPKPFVLQTSLDDFYVSYELNAYTDRPGKMALIYSDLHKNIQTKFKEAGVEIMSPHYSAIRSGAEVAIPGDQKKYTRAIEVNIGSKD
ncbi:MAG: mechanosensitive ion channel family protein [Bdellovibrionales bacterium]